MRGRAVWSRTGALLAGALAAGVVVAACATAPRGPPVRTVERVDLRRYLGTWYEIAAYPQRYEKGCTGTTATYSARDDGRIDVVNRCRKGSLAGPLEEAHGLARTTDASGAKLEVSFFRPFWGDYWILDLGPDYEYAAVGDPGRGALWILARTPHLDPAVDAALRARFAAQGWDLSRLVETPQP
jgi:apolipoprotein D and lipocalin family protein